MVAAEVDMIRIIAVGKLKDRRLADLCDDYRRRLRPYARLEVTELRDQGPEREGRQMLDLLGGTSGHEYVVAMDEKGRDLTSREFSSVLGRHGSMAFLVGGADGLITEVRQRADLVMGLSHLTFTHEMARMLLLEQVYRGFSILRNLPYHRD